MVIDAHTHAGELVAMGGDRTQPTNIVYGYELHCNIMDNNDIDQVVLLPPSSYNKSKGIHSTRQLNDSMRALENQHPRVIHALATVEPTHGDASLEEIERIAQMGFKGIAWHHRLQGAAIDDPAMRGYLERAGQHGMAVFIHSFPYSNLEDLSRVRNIADATEEPIVVLDAFANPENVNLAIEMGKEFKHLYFDTAMLFSTGKIVERIVIELGADRLLFGSNFYAHPLRYESSSDLYQVREADISKEARQNILERNVKRILST